MSDNPPATPRDPRIDPQPGDVLRKRSVRRFVTFRGYGPSVVNVEDGGWIKPPRCKYPSLKQFRRWAATATVEHIAVNSGDRRSPE